MNQYIKWRHLTAPAIAAIAAGSLIWWGGTDFSVFETLMLLSGIATVLWLLKGKDSVPVSELIDSRSLVLVGVCVLISVQFLYAPENVPVFAGVTLYLAGLYFLVRFWLRQNTGLFNFALVSYLATAIVMSAIGFGRYLLAIVPIEWNLLPYEIRWRGFLDDPVVYGALLVPAVLTFGYLAVCSEYKHRFFLYTVAALLCFSNLVLSGSRGAWLGLIVSALVLGFLHREILRGQRFFRVLIGSAAAFVLALVLVYIVPLEGRTYYDSTLGGRFEGSDAPRISNLERSAQLVFERPPLAILLGSGSGSYEHFSPDGFSAHNTYLRVLFEQGILGLVLLLAFLYLTIRAAWQGASADRGKAALLIALIIGIMVHSLFVDTLHWRHFWLILALI